MVLPQGCESFLAASFLSMMVHQGPGAKTKPSSLRLFCQNSENSNSLNIKSRSCLELSLALNSFLDMEKLDLMYLLG